MGKGEKEEALMPQIVMTSIDTKGYLSVRHGVSELRTSVGRFKETTDINQHVGFKTRMARLLQDFLIASRTLPKNIVREVFGLCRGAARRRVDVAVNHKDKARKTRQHLPNTQGLPSPLTLHPLTPCRVRIFTFTTSHPHHDRS